MGCPYTLSAWCPGALTSWDATRFTILEKEAGGHRESSKRSGTRTTQREQKPMEAPHFHCQGGISTPPPCIRFCRLAPGKCLPSAVPHARRVGHTSSRAGGEGHEDKHFFSGGCRSFPTSQQQTLSPTADPALPASVPTGLIRSGLCQDRQSASFRDLGRERYEGKKKQQRNRLQKWTPD